MFIVSILNFQSLTPYQVSQQPTFVLLASHCAYARCLNKLGSCDSKSGLCILDRVIPGCWRVDFEIGLDYVEKQKLRFQYFIWWS